MKLIKHQKVIAPLTDFNANLSVLGAIQLVEEAITELMGELKIDGLTIKKEYKAVWVFTKTKIKFLKNISWNDQYTITCFPSKIGNVTIYFDVAIKNATDELCVYSKTELCALDIETGRIRRVSTVGVDNSIETDVSFIDVSFTKIDEVNLPVVEQVKVRLTSIDYVVHTNNKEYARFILNTYSVFEIKERPIREIEILYINQSYEGDILTIRKGCFGNKDVFEIQREDKNIVKCAILRASS